MLPQKVLTDAGTILPFVSMLGEQMQDVGPKLIKKAVNDYINIYRVFFFFFRVFFFFFFPFFFFFFFLPSYNKECKKPFTLIFTLVVLLVSEFKK